MATNQPWPTELRLRDGGKLLTISFDDGANFDLTAEYLRVLSPSAEVRGHSAAQRQIQVGKRDVIIRQIVPTGNYAVRLEFDDGHTTGIYGFGYLYELGMQHAEKWRAHLDELTARGLSR
jgi:DUF971 family protein